MDGEARATDLQRFIDLYRSFGIECVVTQEDWRKFKDDPPDVQVIYLGESGMWGGSGDKRFTRSKKFGGYNGFYSSVIFDMDGKFIKQGFWE